MRKHLLAALTLVLVAGCAGDAPTGPVVSSSASASASRTYGYYPGYRRTADAMAGKFVPLNCEPRVEATGSAVIGPAGGVLRIGTHRLIVPPGALRERVLISGTVPAERPFQVDLQPHGLQFHRAAGLILDASSCTDVPPIVYLIDQYNVTPPVFAFYSNLWKAIAAPIWHFSGYMVYFGEASGEVSAQ